MYTIEGITDERDSCDCCGKTNLKRTVVLRTEDGEFVFFGTTCAARAMKRTVKEVKAGIKSAEDRKREIERAAWQKAQDEEHARWVAHLVAKTGGIKDWSGSWDILGMIRACGGYDAAHEGFER